jgi:hypothetical protein
VHVLLAACCMLQRPKRRRSAAGAHREGRSKKQHRVAKGGEDGEVGCAANDASQSDGSEAEEDEERADKKGTKGKSLSDKGGAGAGGGKKLAWVPSESADALASVAADNISAQVQVLDAGGVWLRGSITKVLREGKECKEAKAGKDAGKDRKEGQGRSVEYLITLDDGEEVRQWLPSERVQVGVDQSELEQQYANKGLRLRDSGRWEVRVRVKGKKKYIGMYDSAKSAAEAHDKVMAKLKSAGGGNGKAAAAYKPGASVLAVGKSRDGTIVGELAVFLACVNDCTAGPGQ